MDFSRKCRVDSPLLNAVELINNKQLLRTISIIKKNLGVISKKTVTVLGLAFKPDTDDIRDSVSIKMIELLLKNRVKVVVHDPKAIQNTKKIFGSKIKYTESINDALNGSHCAIIMTAWNDYMKLTNKDFRFMKNKLVIDSRRILAKKNLKLNYYAIGIGR